MVDDLIIMDKKRKERRKDTAEVFTPFSLCDIMGNMISDDIWKNPEKTFLDNCCGNGQILLYIIDRKLESGSTYIEALTTTFGLDIMQDNIDECKQRIINLLDDKNIQYDKKKVEKILNHNIVCTDSLADWDYEMWEPKVKESNESIELF